MDHRLVYSKPASRDLEEIVRFIARDDVRAAERVGLELVELAESLVKLPQRGAKVRGRPGVRKLLHGNYLLLYRVDDGARHVLIQRFWHTKRDERRMTLE